MNEVNRIINECGLSKVRVSKYLGVSRQMLYNYLSLDNMNDLPNDKKNRLFKLFNVDNEDELKAVVVNNKYIEDIEERLNDNLTEIVNRDNLGDLRGLDKKSQELLTDVFCLLKDKLIDDDKDNTVYKTLKYLYYYIQSMDQVPELKYILAYFSKYNALVPTLEFIYNEDKQYMFEGILYSALMLYSNGNPSKTKVSESHRKFEMDIESKQEEKLSRTQELNTFRQLALQELGYSSINEQNAKEVFEKIAEIMSRKF